MEKERRNCSTRASSSKPPLIFPNTAEQDNLTKPERLVSNLKHLSFAAGLLALANQAAEEYESLPVRIDEDAYEQRKRELMIQQRAKSISTSHNKDTKVVKEASGVCKSFVGNSLSFDDLLVLANTASVAFHREGSRDNGSEEMVAAAEEHLPPLGVEEHTCKQREDGDVDRGGSCFGLPEELRTNREVMQQRCKTEVAKPNGDPSDACREDRLFEKKYVRKKRVNHNKNHMESTSVGAVAASSNIGHKSSSLINVDDAQREEEGLYDNGENRNLNK